MATRKVFPFLLSGLLLFSCGGKTPVSKESSVSESITSEVNREMHNYSIYNDGVEFKSSLWEKPEFFYDEDKDNEGCKGLFIRSDYNDKKSFAFAYLGIPNDGKEKHPAVLLLHGGGGTSYFEWVNAWVDRGYVALAIDLEGHIPNKDGRITMGPSDLYYKSEYETPHNSNLSDENENIELTWLHYACRTAIIANSFLHNLDYVDEQKIGLSGVSWGGYISSIISGYDDRFAFAVPIYCTVNMLESGTPIGEYIKAHNSFAVFDKYEPITLVNTPIHLVVSNSDIYGNPLVVSDLVSFMQNGTFSILNRFPHSHFDALNIVEPFVYADSIINHQALPKFNVEDQTNIKVEDVSQSEVQEAYLYSTEEEVVSNATRWSKQTVKCENNTIAVTPDEETKYYYVSIINSRGAEFTSPVIIL